MSTTNGKTELNLTTVITMADGGEHDVGVLAHWSVGDYGEMYIAESIGDVPCAVYAPGSWLSVKDVPKGVAVEVAEPEPDPEPAPVHVRLNTLDAGDWFEWIRTVMCKTSQQSDASDNHSVCLTRKGIPRHLHLDSLVLRLDMDDPMPQPLGEVVGEQGSGPAEEEEPELPTRAVSDMEPGTVFRFHHSGGTVDYIRPNHIDDDGSECYTCQRADGEQRPWCFKGHVTAEVVSEPEAEAAPVQPQPEPQPAPTRKAVEVGDLAVGDQFEWRTGTQYTRTDVVSNRYPGCFECTVEVDEDSVKNLGFSFQGNYAVGQTRAFAKDLKVTLIRRADVEREPEPEPTPLTIGQKYAVADMPVGTKFRGDYTGYTFTVTDEHYSGNTKCVREHDGEPEWINSASRHKVIGDEPEPGEQPSDEGEAPTENLPRRPLNELPPGTEFRWAGRHYRRDDSGPEEGRISSCPRIAEGPPVSLMHCELVRVVNLPTMKVGAIPPGAVVECFGTQYVRAERVNTMGCIVCDEVDGSAQRHLSVDRVVTVVSWPVIEEPQPGDRLAVGDMPVGTRFQWHPTVLTVTDRKEVVTGNECRVCTEDGSGRERFMHPSHVATVTGPEPEQIETEPDPTPQPQPGDHLSIADVEVGAKFEWFGEVYVKTRETSPYNPDRFVCILDHDVDTRKKGDKRNFHMNKRVELVAAPEQHTVGSIGLGVMFKVSGYLSTLVKTSKRDDDGDWLCLCIDDAGSSQGSLLPFEDDRAITVLGDLEVGVTK